MPRREQVPGVLLAVAAVAVAAALIILVRNVHRAAPSVEEAARFPRAVATSSAAPPPIRALAEPLRRAPPAPGDADDPPPPPRPPPGPAGVARPPGLADRAPGSELAAIIADAIGLYDRGIYDEAAARALEALAREPDNVRMLRILVSSSCIEGEVERARTYFARLPPRDQKDIAKRCADKSGIKF